MRGCPSVIGMLLFIVLLLASPAALHAQGMDAAVPRWGTYVGGTGDDRVLSVATDGHGHVYVAGRTTDSLLLGNDTTGRSGFTHQRHFGGGASDAFLAKYAPQGAMLWCTYFGGAGDEEAVQLVVADTNDVFLVGHTTSTDSLATDTLAYQSTHGGGTDLFLAHFTDAGILVGATYFGGPADERATGAAFDAQGRVVVCGYADGPGAISAPLPQQPWTAGEDGLLLLFDGTADLLAGTYVGGEHDDRLVQVSRGDSTGTVVLGNTNSTMGIATPGALTETLQGERDAFLLKVDTAMQVQHGTYFGGSGDEEAQDLVRQGDTLVIGGNTFSTQLYGDSSSFQPVNAGGGDGFLAVLDMDFGIHWSTFIGDTAPNTVMALAMDPLGGIYLAGTTPHQPTAPDTLIPDTGTTDVFLMRFVGPDSLDWLVHTGAFGEEEAQALCVKGHTSIFLGGRTSSTWGATSNPHQELFGGGAWDGFATRLDQERSTLCLGIGACTDGGGSGGGGGGGSWSGGGYQTVSPPVPTYHVCLGDSIVFVAYGGALGYDAKWMWYADSCGANSQYLSMGDTLVLFPDHDFRLFVRAEGLDHVTDCRFADIVVHAMPVPVVSASDTVCAGAPITVHGSGAEHFAWLLNDSVVATGPHALFPAPMEGGVAQVTAVATNGPACTVQVPLNVVVLPAPEVDWHISHIGCAGEPGTIELVLDSAATGPGPIAVQWQPDSLHGTLLTGLSAGSYVLTATDTLLGCARTDTLHLLMPATVDAQWAVTHINCAGDPGSIALAAPELDSVNSALAITWMQSGLTGPVVSGLAAGAYAVALADTLGCSRMDTLVVRLPPSALAAWDITPVTCAGGSDGAIALVHPDLALSDSAFLSLAWAVPGLSGQMLDSLPAGNYTVTVTDTLGCSRTETLTVPMPPPLIDQVMTTYALCGAPTGTAQVQSSSHAPGLLFDFGNGPAPAMLAEQLAPGNYTVIATDSTGCHEEAGFTIASYGELEVSIAADTLLAEQGTTVLAATITPVDDQAIFQWTPSTGLADPTAATTACQVEDTMTYVIQAISPFGCMAFDTVVVVPWFPEEPVLPAPCGAFFLPDHFSPNGDGLNDKLCLLGGCIATVEWMIHDRWGGLLFSSTDPQACWDGTRQGAILPAGTYLSAIRVVRTNGEELRQSGTITLHR